MTTQETKDKGANAVDSGFGCCSPENFQKMFEMMSKCCPGQKDSPDFSSMKDNMMKPMMEGCFGGKPTRTEENACVQKEKDEETGPA